jgi:hypothetical protein
VGLPLRF